MFFKLRRNLRELRKMLEVEDDFPHVHYTIRDIRSVEDIAPALIERSEQEGLIYDDLWQWLFDKNRHEKISKYLPTLFQQLHEKVFINYLHLANIAVTGEARSSYTDWNWDAVSDKKLVKGFLQQHIDDYAQGEDKDRARKAHDILYRIEHQDSYTREELSKITSADFFIEVAHTAMPEGLDIVENWALLGHSGAYQLLMKTLKESDQHKDLLDKWQGIMDKVPNYPIQISDSTFNNQDDLQLWLRDGNNTELLEAYPDVSISQWLTIMQALSSRAADLLSEECRKLHLASSLDKTA